MARHGQRKTATIRRGFAKRTSTHLQGLEISGRTPLHEAIPHEEGRVSFVANLIGANPRCYNPNASRRFVSTEMVLTEKALGTNRDRCSGSYLASANLIRTERTTVLCCVVGPWPLHFFNFWKTRLPRLPQLRSGYDDAQRNRAIPHHASDTHFLPPLPFGRFEETI